MPLLERGLTANLSPTRDVGVQLFGDVLAGMIHYALGVFNGAVDNASADLRHQPRQGFRRPTVLPSIRHRRLAGDAGLGVSASTGNQSGTPSAPGLPTYRAPDRTRSSTT